MADLAHLQLTGLPMPPPDTPHTRAQEVRLTDETIEYLEKQISKAVAKGISEAMTEETAKKFWFAGLAVLQENAVKHTGRFVLGSLAGMFKKAMTFMLLGYIVYTLGGWTALAKFWNMLWSAP